MAKRIQIKASKTTIDEYSGILVVEFDREVILEGNPDNWKMALHKLTCWNTTKNVASEFNNDTFDYLVSNTTTEDQWKTIKLRSGSYNLDTINDELKRVLGSNGLVNDDKTFPVEISYNTAYHRVAFMLKSSTYANVGIRFPKTSNLLETFFGFDLDRTGNDDEGNPKLGEVDDTHIEFLFNTQEYVIADSGPNFTSSSVLGYNPEDVSLSCDIIRPTARLRGNQIRPHLADIDTGGYPIGAKISYSPENMSWIPLNATSFKSVTFRLVDINNKVVPFADTIYITCYISHTSGDTQALTDMSNKLTKLNAFIEPIAKYAQKYIIGR
jgi:hypothetical protein